MKKPVIKDGEKTVTVSKIAKVVKVTGGWSIKKTDGWSVWIAEKYGVTPMVNDTIIVFGKPFGVIQGIQINDKVLWHKTDEEIEQEHREWVEKTRKNYDREYAELMEKIKDEEPFETIDVSGMGSGYERACQLMLRAGIKFLKEHSDFHFDYRGFKNVYGITLTDTPWGKDLDKTLMDAVGGDCTGAMHQAVIGHLLYIHKNGIEKWLTEFAERKYLYPKELPNHNFGKVDE